MAHRADACRGRAVRTGLGPLKRSLRALTGVASAALALATPAVRADEPPTPLEGAVAWAWADGSALVSKPGTPGVGEYRAIATVLNIVAPGSGASSFITAVDAATSAAVLAGGSASVSVNEITSAPDAQRVGVVRATVTVRAPGSVAARVRELLGKAGTAREKPLEDPLSSVEFTLGFGPESAPPAAVATASTRIAVHRAALVSDSSKGAVCAQVFVDLNTLRRCAPESMDSTTLASVLGVWAMANARDVMLTARLVPAAGVTTRDPALVVPPTAVAPDPYTGPAMVRVDITWSARSEEPSKVSRGALAAGFWSPAQEALPAGARWIAAARTDIGGITLRTLRTHAARLEPGPRGAFSRDVDRWAQVHGAAMDRLAQATRGWIVLWPSDTGVGLNWRAVPGAALAMESFGRDAGAVLTPFPAAASADANGVRVVTLPGMTIGFAPVSGGSVVGTVEFDESAADRVRGAVGARVKK